MGFGLLAGLAAYGPVSRVLETFLYETGRFDPVILSLASGLVAGVLLTVSSSSARRASRTDPATVLRAE